MKGFWAILSLRVWKVEPFIQDLELRFRQDLKASGCLVPKVTMKLRFGV